MFLLIIILFVIFTAVAVSYYGSRAKCNSDDSGIDRLDRQYTNKAARFTEDVNNLIMHMRCSVCKSTEPPSFIAGNDENSGLNCCCAEFAKILLAIIGYEFKYVKLTSQFQCLSRDRNLAESQSYLVEVIGFTNSKHVFVNKDTGKYTRYIIATASSGENSVAGKSVGEVFRLIKYPIHTVLELPALKGDYDQYHNIATSDIIFTSENHEKHQVDLFNLTCSCRRFKNNRSHLSQRDMRRVDVHILHALNCAKSKNFKGTHKGTMILAIDEYDDFTKVLLSQFSATHFSKIELSTGMPIYLLFSVGSPWINVVTRQRRKGDAYGNYSGKFDAYGFNILEGRWAYGSGPDGAIIIKEQIARLFEYRGDLVIE